MTLVKLPRLLDANLAYKATLHPVSVSIDEQLEPLSTASMTLEKDEWANVGDYIELYTQRGFAGVYRVSSSSRTYTGQSTVELEHAICTLGDGVIPGEGEISGTAQEVVTSILAHQVTRANGANLWRAGSVSGGNTAFEHDYHNILTGVIETVAGIDGRMLTFDQTAFPWTLGAAQMETTPSCEGRLSRNLLSVSVTYDDSDLCTRLYCDDLEGDVKSIDGPTIGTYGPRCKTIRAGENVTQESLRSYMTRYLEEHKDPSVAIEIDAIDLSEATGEPLDRLDVGKLCRIALPDYGITLNERIISRHTVSVYDEPDRVRLSLANRIRDTAQNFVRLQNDTTGGTRHNSATGGRTVGGGGSGNSLNTQSLVDMLKIHEEELVDHDVLIHDAGIELSKQGVRLYDTETKLDTAFGRIETAEAEIIVQAGQILQRATYTDLEGVRSEVYIELDAFDDEITLKASKVYVDAQITQVKTLIADEIDAAIADINLSMAETVVTNYLTVTGRATLSALALGGENVSKTTIPIVTSFTQASGETAGTTSYTLLTTSAGSDTAHDVAAGMTKTF